MQSVSVGEFKANFSSFLELVRDKGEKIVVNYGKNHKKVAMLVPYEKPLKKKRKFGILKGKGGFEMSEDFKMSEEEFIS